MSDENGTRSHVVMDPIRLRARIAELEGSEGLRDLQGGIMLEYEIVREALRTFPAKRVAADSYMAGSDQRRSLDFEGLRRAHMDLERQVEMCTAELSTLKERLESEIEERKYAENALLAGEAKFRVAALYSNDLIYEWDFSNDRVEWYGDIDATLGYAPGDFPRTLDGWEQALHPEDRDRVIEALKEHILNRKPFGLEYRIRQKTAHTSTG